MAFFWIDLFIFFNFSKVVVVTTNFDIFVLSGHFYSVLPLIYLIPWIFLVSVHLFLHSLQTTNICNQFVWYWADLQHIWSNDSFQQLNLKLIGGLEDKIGWPIYSKLSFFGEFVLPRTSSIFFELTLEPYPRSIPSMRYRELNFLFPESHTGVVITERFKYCHNYGYFWLRKARRASNIKL